MTTKQQTTLVAAITAVLPDLEHYARTHGPGPDRRLADLKEVLTSGAGLHAQCGRCAGVTSMLCPRCFDFTPRQLGDEDRPKLPQDLTDAVAFARFAIDYRIDPGELAYLVLLIRRAASAGERWCNKADNREAYERAMRAVEETADRLGLKHCDWPGLYPTFDAGPFRQHRVSGTVHHVPMASR